MDRPSSLHAKTGAFICKHLEIFSFMAGGGGGGGGGGGRLLNLHPALLVSLRYNLEIVNPTI